MTFAYCRTDTSRGNSDCRHVHRVDRVPGFLSSRSNWLPPPPYPQAKVALQRTGMFPPPPHPPLPPFGYLVPGGGGDTFTCGRGGGGSKFGRRDGH